MLPARGSNSGHKRCDLPDAHGLPLKEQQLLAHVREVAQSIIERVHEVLSDSDIRPVPPAEPTEEPSP